MKHKELTYAEQRLWLRCLGKVLLENNYTLVMDSLVIERTPDPRFIGFAFSAFGDAPILLQAQEEFEKAMEFGMLEE